MVRKKSKNIFLINVASVFIIQILIKIVGMLYNVFLTNNKQYSDLGNGIFLSAHQIYILFLSVSIVGIPVSISKIISERSRNSVDVEKIINISLMFWGIIGVIESVLLILISNYIANNVLENKIIEDILKILSVGIVFVNFNSVYRGALNGIEKTSIGTMIQFIEQLIKVGFIIIGIYWLKIYSNETRENIIYIVSWGVTFSVIVTFGIYRNKWKKFKNNIIENSNIRYKEILKNVLFLSIPVTILGIFGSINKNIDSISIMKILSPIIGVEGVSQGYGIIASKVDVLINLPIGLNSAITVSLLPRISKLYKENKLNLVKDDLITSMYMSLLIAIPFMFIYVFFSENILQVLYPNANEGVELLKIGSVLIVLNVVIQILMVFYNAIGKTNIVIKSFMIGSILKLILNLVFLNIKGILERGILLSSIISDILIIILLVINKKFKILNIKLKELKILNIICNSSMMIFISACIIFILKVNNLYNKFLFVISLRNRGICIFLSDFW